MHACGLRLCFVGHNYEYPFVFKENRWTSGQALIFEAQLEIYSGLWGPMRSMGIQRSSYYPQWKAIKSSLSRQMFSFYARVRSSTLNLFLLFVTFSSGFHRWFSGESSLVFVGYFPFSSGLFLMTPLDLYVYAFCLKLVTELFSAWRILNHSTPIVMVLLWS